MASHAGRTSHTGYTEQARTGGMAVTGLTAFAGVMMIFGGIMAIFQGIAGIAKDDIFVVTRDYAYTFNLTSWGWIHLTLGVLVALAGVALFTGAMWARITGIALASLAMLANFMWLPYYPLWSVVLIAVDAFVIWALCVGTKSDTQSTA